MQFLKSCRACTSCFLLPPKPYCTHENAYSKLGKDKAACSWLPLLSLLMFLLGGRVSFIGICKTPLVATRQAYGLHHIYIFTAQSHRNPTEFAWAFYLRLSHPKLPGYLNITTGNHTVRIPCEFGAFVRRFSLGRCCVAMTRPARHMVNRVWLL